MRRWQSQFKNYYNILQVSVNADTEVIQAAYKALMKKYHPDLNNTDIDISKSQDINEAYQVLRHLDSRADYDSQFKKHNSEVYEHLSYHYLKEWEERLKEKEIKLNDEENKLKYQGIKLDSQKHKIHTQLAEEFYHSNDIQMEIIIKQIQHMNISDQTHIFERILNFYKLPLGHEILVLYCILSNKLDHFYKQVVRGFKYKSLYLLLFEYLLEYNLQEYKSKIEVTVKNINFQNIDNLILIEIITKIYKKWFHHTEYTAIKQNFYKQMKGITRKDRKNSSSDNQNLYQYLIGYLKE